jgi:hypothetical protein
VLRPLPCLLLCKSLQLSNRRVDTSGKRSPLAQPSRLAPIAAGPREKKDCCLRSTTRPLLHEPQCGKCPDLPILDFAGWLHRFAYPRLYRCIPGGTVHFLPTCPYCNLLVILYRYPSPSNHVLLRTTGMAGSCASSLMGAATAAVQIWYDIDL